MATAQGNLGNVLKDLGRLDEAALAYDIAISLKPDFIDSHYELSALKTYRADDVHVASRHAGAAARSGERIAGGVASALLVCAGQDARRSGSLRRIVCCLPRRQQLATCAIAGGRNRWTRRCCNACCLCFPRNSLLRGRSISLSTGTSPGKAPIFIVGMPRSGTSLLEQILASYPGVFGAGELPDLSDVVSRCHAGVPTSGIFPRQSPAYRRRRNCSAWASNTWAANLAPCARRRAHYRQNAGQFLLHRHDPPDAAQRKNHPRDARSDGLLFFLLRAVIQTRQPELYL